MPDLPASDVGLVEDPDEIHKIYKQSFIDEQVNLFTMVITIQKTILEGWRFFNFCLQNLDIPQW